jgi:peptide/nickel transport system substrate-binding protein
MARSPKYASQPAREPRGSSLSRRTFLRASLATGGVAAAGGLLAACQPAAPAPAKPAPAAPAGAPAPAQPAVAAPARSALDEWTVAVSEDITTIDPLVPGGGAIRWNVMHHIFDPLVGYEGPNYQPTPRLAESWRYLDDNTLEMVLRRGVKFHNGDDFTADDVLYNYQVHRDTPTLGTTYVFEPVERLEKVDSHTIRFITKTPVASLLPNMAQIFFIAPRGREQIGADAFGKRLIGTGMYRLATEWTRDQPVALVANDAYWEGPASPTRLQFKFLREPSTRVAELQRGTLQTTENIPLPQVDLLKRGANTDVAAAKGARIMYYSINLTREPFTNVKVRQALNYAVDRDAVVRGLLQGYGQPHVGLFAPGWMGYAQNVEPYRFDVARAKQLLAEAGLPNGFEFEWQITDGVFLKDREIAEAVAAQLKQAGITARLRVLERATIYDNVYAGNFDVVSGQWPGTSDPDRYLQWLFIRTGGVKDAPEMAQVYQIMEEGRTILDLERRAQKYQALNKLAYEQAFLLYVHVQDELYGVDKRAGWTPYPLRALATQHWYALHPTIKR